MGKLNWVGGESVRASVKNPDAFHDEPENQKVLNVCYEKYGEVKFRINIGAYGPGTMEKPRPRFWWLLGESATIVCRNVDVANWFREEFKEFIRGLDGVELEGVDESAH
jgi:hypothetical protein